MLEAMAATGLRAIRYAKEVAGIGQVIANDMDSGAVQSMRRNIDFNGVQDKVTPSESDARLVLLQHCQVRPSSPTTGLDAHKRRRIHRCRHCLKPPYLRATPDAACSCAGLRRRGP